MEEVWYLCDPIKNTDCRKGICYLKDVNGQRKKSSCRMTKNPDFAEKDENGEPEMEHMINVSAKYLSEWLEMDTDVVSCVRMACAIAEGWRRGQEIYRLHKANQHAKKLMSIFRAEDDDDEEE